MTLGIFMERRISILAVIMLLGIALAACGGSSSSSTSAAATSGAGAASTTTTIESTVASGTPEGVASMATPVASPEASEASPVAGSTTILVRNDDKLGKILTDAKGFTLYVYAKDTQGKSACNGACATNWPPLKADGTPTAPDGVTGALSVITRDDGSTMVAYNCKPLYTYIKDTDPEDTYGQGVGNVWTVATP